MHEEMDRFADRTAYWYIQCNLCLAATAYKISEAEAVRAWNRRLFEEKQSGIIDRLLALFGGENEQM